MKPFICSLLLLASIPSAAVAEQACPNCTATEADEAARRSARQLADEIEASKSVTIHVNSALIADERRAHSLRDCFVKGLRGENLGIARQEHMPSRINHIRMKLESREVLLDGYGQGIFRSPGTGPTGLLEVSSPELDSCTAEPQQRTQAQ